MIQIIKGFFTGIGAFFRLWCAVKTFRKDVEKKGVAYWSRRRALHLRFNCEKIADRLARGDTQGLPKIVRWIFARTKIDEAFGRFCQVLLKSEKLATNDERLGEPIKPYPCH